jgi:hypothetical protein
MQVKLLAFLIAGYLCSGGYTCTCLTGYENWEAGKGCSCITVTSGGAAFNGTQGTFTNAE